MMPRVKSYLNTHLSDSGKRGWDVRITRATPGVLVLGYCFIIFWYCSEVVGGNASWSDQTATYSSYNMIYNMLARKRVCSAWEFTTE